MKNFFGALTVLVVLVLSNVTFAAKIQPLAEIDAQNFFLNMGYDVDCSHWERRNGKQFYFATLPEDPLVFSKDYDNVELYADMRTGRIVEINLYLQSDADAKILTTCVAKIISALDADAFKKNQAAIEQNIAEFIAVPAPAERTVAIDADRQFAFGKEELRGKVLMIHIQRAAA